MAGPCNVTPLKGLAKVLGLQEGKQISYAEWVDAFRKGVEKGDIKLDKNGNIEFGEKAETTIRQANLLSDFRSHLGLDKKSDVYTMENVDEIDKTGFSKLQVKVLEDVKRVMGAVNNLVKNVAGKELSVNVHRSEEQYKKALMELGESEEAAMSKGVYISEDGVIHLNMNRVSSETFLHEAFHPVLDYLAANNPKLIDSLYKQLRGIEGGQDFTKKSAKSYKGGGALTIKKEAITDFIANVADGTFELTKTNYEKVKNFIKDLLRKMGIKIPEKYSDIRDIEDLKDLAEFVSQSFKTGKEIESVELAEKKEIDNQKQLSQFAKWGDFEKLGFEETKDFEDLVKSGHIIQDAKLTDLYKMPVFIINPDNMLVGSVKFGGKEVGKGQGGIHFVSATGDIFAFSDTSRGNINANQLAEFANKQLKEKGEANILLSKGSLEKLFSSHAGAKGAMRVLEAMVDKKIISKSDFRNALKSVSVMKDIDGGKKELKKLIDLKASLEAKGKELKEADRLRLEALQTDIESNVGRKYDINFTGAKTETIHNDIEQQFFNKSDNTFSNRGTFVVDVIEHLVKNADISKEQVLKLREFLNTKELPKTTERKSGDVGFAVGPIKESIGLLFSDEATIGARNSEVYAVIKIQNPKFPVRVVKGGHESYGAHVRQVVDNIPLKQFLSENKEFKKEDLLLNDKNEVIGIRPKLLLLPEKYHIADAVNDKNNNPVGEEKLGSNQIGIAEGIVKDKFTDTKKGGGEKPSTKKKTLNFSKGEPERKVYDETGFISVPTMVEIVKSNNPDYLGDVMNHIVEMGEKLKKGAVDTKDVAKAYLMAVSSIRSGDIKVETFEKAIGHKVDDVFLEPNNRIRTEGAMSYLLSTDRGKDFIKHVESGKITKEDRDFIANSMRPFGMFGEGQKKYEALFGVASENEINLTNIVEFKDLLKGGVKNEQELFDKILKLKQIRQGKVGFISNFLGVGTRGVIDAREIQGWLRGTVFKGERTKTEAEIEKQLGKSLKDLTPVQKEILNRMKAVGDAFGIDPAISAYTGHHMIWDAVAGERTTHDGLYLAMKQTQAEFDSRLREIRQAKKTEDKKKGIQYSKVENDKVADTYYEPHMTESEDGKDYVFFHVSNADPKDLEKGIDSRRFGTLSTSREEKATQYGVASFYTKPEDTESMVRGNKYVVRVPKDKVYPMDTDPNEYRERAEAMIAKDAPFRAAAVKKKMAEMAASDGYQMAVGEWRFDRKGQKVLENEFRADALVPLKPTKESPQGYASNIAKGMERIPHPNQENYLRADKLNDLAEKVKAYYSSKSKYGEAYQMASSIVNYGGIMENLNQPNERVRPVTKEDFDIMTKDLPPELKSVANTLQFSRGEEETNDMMKDWVASQFKAGIGESDLIEVLKQYGLEDKKAKDIVAAAVESLNEPTKAQKNKQRADAVNPFINYTPDETGVQNMVATLERIQQGKEPIEISASDKRDWKETMRRANEFFLNPNNNVEDLVYRLKNGAAPTAEDVAVMSMHKVDLDRQMAEALERRARLVAEGNPEFLKEDAKIADISSRLEDYYEAARRSAYEQGLAFNIRKMMLANDYSIGTVLRRIKAAGDEVVPTKVMEQIETLTSQLKQNTERILELEDQLQKERAQATLDAIKETQVTKTKEKAKTPAKTRVEKAVSAIQSIRAKINVSSYFGGEKPAGKKGDFQYSKEEADDAATALEKGLSVIERSLKAGLSVSRAIEKGVKSINKAMKGVKWDEEKFRKDVSEGFISEGVDIDKTEISDLEVKDGKLNITRGYLESLVENGYDTIDQMVDYIKETEAGEKFTEREIMDAISGYGEVEYPTQDEVSRKISIAKGEGKSLSALADVVKGMLPKRSGFQRREKTDRERTLLKEIRQRLKAFPEDAEKSAKSWASALDRIKSTYRNRITDLENAIKENKKIFKEKRETKLDDEAKSLKEQKEALQSVYDKMFAPEIKSNIEKLVDRVNEYTKKINEAKKNNDPDAERKAQIEKDLTEGVITDLKAAARANRTEQEKKLDELKNRLRKQIEQLNKKIDGTYEEKAKIEFTLDDEAVGLTQEVEQLKGLLEGMTGSKTESDAEKSERLVNYYEKQVAQLEADIEAMNIGYKVRSTFAPTPEMQRLKDKLDDLREMRQMLREQLGLAYERDVKLAEKRNERAIKELEQKRQAIINGTYKPKLKKPTPTSNLIEIQKKTKAAISNQIEQIIADRERANRGKFQKVVDSISEVFRASVLSGVATLEKLMGYGIMESHIAQPLGGLVVGQVTRAIPYINRINKMAGGRMTLSPAEEAKKVAKGVATFWSKDTWSDTKQVAKTGKSELDLLWGEFKVTHPEIGAWVGHLHKALKNPTVRASFVRHMEGNLIYFSETMKMSVSDPAVVEMASRTSLLDAYSDILLNKNWVSNQWNALIRSAELMGKGKSVYLQNTGIALAGFLKILEPVTGVPVNAANRLISYYPPIGAARAMLGILSNAVKGIKPEEMTREEAAGIIRNIKAAGVGAIGYAVGYIFADLFGGSDDDEKFRNEMGLKKGEFAFMPKAMGHHALWEIMQIGATDRRMDDKGEGDAANKFNNFKKLSWEYVENTPFFDLPLTIEEAMTEKGGASRVVGGLARNMTTPMFVQQLSKFMDTDAEGNPVNRSRDGFLDELASGVYPFRTNLPVKGGFMLKERDKKYLEDIYFVPKMAKKTDDKFTLKGKEVITDDEYKTYTNNVNRDFNEFLGENIDALRYRGYSQEEEDEINKDLVEPMTIVEISKSLEKKKKDMMSRAKAAIERKQTLEYQYNKNMITTEVYDREIKSAETELKNISNWINEIKE